MTNKYWNGKVVCVVADEVQGMPGKAIVRIVENLCDRPHEFIADTIVDKIRIEPIITDAFKLHDHVKVTNGSMIGTIVGFEPSTNRAVVMSDKIKNYNNDRTRYSYKPNELELFDDNLFKFIPGCWYKVTYNTGTTGGTVELMSVQSVFNSDEVMLFNKQGEIMFNNIAKDASLSHLKQFNNIDKVRLLCKI
jgi:hypothetical protein